MLTQSVLRELNALRTRQGLPPASLTNAYDADVMNAAVRNTDPALGAFTPGAVVQYGLWGISTADPASNTLDPTTIVDDWVDRDGWQGAKTENLDCTSPTAPGCNGHRRAALSSAPHPGDKLAVDIAIHQASWHGTPAISVAMIMVWSEPQAVHTARDRRSVLAHRAPLALTPNGSLGAVRRLQLNSALDAGRHAHRRRGLPRPEPGDPRRLPAALGRRSRDLRRPERLARCDRRRL